MSMGIYRSCFVQTWYFLSLIMLDDSSKTKMEGNVKKRNMVDTRVLLRNSGEGRISKAGYVENQRKCALPRSVEMSLFGGKNQ